MSRLIDYDGKIEALKPEVVEHFLATGVPYRLAMLQFAEEILPPETTRDSAFVEAAIVSGRLLLQFLGLGIKRRGGLRLVESREYHKERRADRRSEDQRPRRSFC
jgi:hypothetical protein